MKQFAIGQQIKYRNGSMSIYTGKVMSVKNNGNDAVVLDTTDKAAVELWNAGYAVGADVNISQIEVN